MEQLKKNSEMSLIRCVRNYTRRRATMIIITRNIRGIRHEDKTYNLKSFTHFQEKKPVIDSISSVHKFQPTYM